VSHFQTSLTGAHDMKRSPTQKKNYALQRMSKAVDRVILGDRRARRWVQAWATAAGIRRQSVDTFRER
jgi:hypothetical protein